MAAILKNIAAIFLLCYLCGGFFEEY